MQLVSSLRESSPGRGWTDLLLRTKKPLEFLEVGSLLGGFAALAVTTLVAFDWYACLVHVIVHGTEVHSPSSTDYFCWMLTTPLGVELGAFWMLHGLILY